MPDKRGMLYEQLAREASKTLVQTRFNIAFRQTLDAYKRGFLAGAKNGYIILDDVKRDIREKLDKLSSKQLSPIIRKIRLPFDDDMLLDLIVKYATQVWGLQARLETKNNYRYVRVTWPLELNMLNLDKTK